MPRLISLWIFRYKFGTAFGDFREQVAALQLQIILINGSHVSFTYPYLIHEQAVITD
jgi:hypothetical protein